MFHAELTKTEEENLRNFFKDEDAEQVQKDLEYLRDWLMMQPHLPHDIENSMLLNFLRGRKYSLEESKAKLDKYYTYKGVLPEYCSNLDPLSDKLKFSLDHQVFCILPGYTPDGHRVLTVSYEGVDPSTFVFEMVMKRMVCCYDTLLASDTLKRGVVIICDVAGIKAAHAIKITIPHLKNSMTLLQEGYPDQFKNLFVMGLSPVSAKIMNICIQCLQEKLKKRVVFISDKNVDQMYQVVPKTMIPKEFGGTSGSMFDMNDRWNKQLIARRDWLIEMGKKKANEARRPGKPKTASDLLGIEGSFRQLAVD